MGAPRYRPGPQPRTVVAEDGQVLTAPADWELLPPGDAACTRRVKAAGPHWMVQQKRGRRTFSQGVWAPSATIATVREQLEQQRGTAAYAKRRDADQRRRDARQRAYVQSFREAVLQYLAFDARHQELAQRLADAVAKHATPVGSGTVARTQQIPIERRAEAAVIAWLRHQTTAYDSMKIPRVKGKRREVRRMLAQRSVELLQRYRQGLPISTACPLWCALESLPHSTEPLTKAPRHGGT